MVPMTTRQKYDVVPMSYDGLTMALRRPRYTREFNTKLNHRVSFLFFFFFFFLFVFFFLHVKDFGAARDGDADGLKSLPMGNDALTNGPMSSRSPPKLKLFIIVCPSRVKIG